MLIFFFDNFVLVQVQFIWMSFTDSISSMFVTHKHVKRLLSCLMRAEIAARGSEEKAGMSCKLCIALRCLPTGKTLEFFGLNQWKGVFKEAKDVRVRKCTLPLD